MSDHAVPAKPLPTLKGIGGKYWQFVQEQHLMFQRCNDCGNQFYYARICCPQCGSEQVEWFESTGRGSVYSFTVVNRHTNPAFVAELPYAIALVEMDDLSPGCRMLARVVDCPPDAVRIGMRIRTTFAPLSEDFLAPVFTPDPQG